MCGILTCGRKGNCAKRNIVRSVIWKENVILHCKSVNDACVHDYVIENEEEEN